MVAAPVTSGRTPNFPTPPSPRPSRILSMPSDLVADGRSYYTEVFFLDFRTAKYGVGSTAASILNNTLSGGAATSIGGGIGGAVAGAVAGGVGNLLSGNVFGAIAGAVGGAAAGGFLGTQLGGFTGAFSSSALRLPIPNKINDILTLNWQDKSALDLVSSLVPGVSQTINVVNTAGAFAGVAVNPLLYLAFNSQTFREFSFDWVLAPKNRQESEAVRSIVATFKNSALPTKGFIMDYPLIAIVRMNPNNLDNNAIFKPMAITAVGANYTPNPVPSFFENTGAPTIVTLSVKFKEIELWFRNERGII